MPDLNALVQQIASKYGVDPKAALAVATHEGAGGGIGDNGTSFGPWQLHYGGAYPSWAPQGAQASQQWAWSPTGIDYALKLIGNASRGLTGGSAVDAIVRRFERPANPDAEVAASRGSYGGLPPSANVSYGTGAAGGSTPAAQPGGLSGKDLFTLMEALSPTHTPQPTPAAAPVTASKPLVAAPTLPDPIPTTSAFHDILSVLRGG